MRIAPRVQARTQERAAEVEQALAPLHPSVQDLLEVPLKTHPDNTVVKAALSFLAQAGTFKKGSYAVGAALIGAGCLFDNAWKDASSVHGDVVGALAKRHVADSADNEAAVSDIVKQVRASGLLDTHAWKHASELSNRRGLLGEALRRMQLDGKKYHVESGLQVVLTPPWLRSARTIVEATAACENNGESAGRLVRYEGGFGLQVTEIDVLVAERTAKGLKPVRFENVKAGIGTASTARDQNDNALAAWASPDLRLLRAGKNVTHTFDRSAKPDKKTVGPLEDTRYDVALPLSQNDITVLAKRLSV